jgi:hypothetical protein
MGCRVRRRGTAQACHLHVKNADGAECARIPLGLIALHGGLHGVSEFSDERNGPSRARKVLFLVPVHGLLEHEKSGDQGKRGVQPSDLFGSGGREKRRGWYVDQGVQS